MKKILLLLAPLMVAGCGSWSRPNTTEAEFNTDRYACQMQVAQTYPVQMVSTPGQTTPMRTTCQTFYGQTTCTTTPGVQYGGVQTDINAIARIGAMESCLQARGYTYSSRQQAAAPSSFQPPKCVSMQVSGEDRTFCQ